MNLPPPLSRPPLACRGGPRARRASAPLEWHKISNNNNNNNNNNDNDDNNNKTNKQTNKQ